LTHVFVFLHSKVSEDVWFVHLNRVHPLLPKNMLTRMGSHMQCFCQTAPLQESRVEVRDGPQKNKKGQFGPFLLQGCRLNTGIAF